jgi:hypothetical protein
VNYPLLALNITYNIGLEEVVIIMWFAEGKTFKQFKGVITPVTSPTKLCAISDNLLIC